MHRTAIHVRWAELDPYHHVNHATYLSYLEHARISALEDISSGMDVLAAQGFQVVVVRVDVRFITPATAGDELVISSAVASIGASASTWHQRVDRGTDRILDATIEAACTDLAGRPVRMPPGLRAGLQTLIEAARE
ncbi:MAG: thioesterase family protein [Actinomycetota bacterium]|jgi:YbgC/YbaW family acyl-CoA thioester hydrolase